MMMKADDLEKYADLMVESFNKALELREASLLKRIAELEARALVQGPAGHDGINGKDAEPINKEALAAEIQAKVVVPVVKDGVDGKDGKDAPPVDVEAIVAAVLKAVPVVHGKDGTPGKDADEERIYVKTAAYAASYIREKVAEIPKPKDGIDGLNGKDAEPINKDALVGELLSKIVVPAGKVGDKGEPGKDAPPVDTAALAHGIYKNVMETLPVPIAGKDGRDGLNGKDAEPIDVKALAADVEGVVIPKVLAAIPAPIPGPPGKDGKDGLTIKGDPGTPGETGPAGNDGINGKDALPVDTKALGDEIVQKVLVQIPPPLHGKDGTDGKSVDIEAVRVLVSGEVIKAVSALPPALPGRDGIAGADGANGLNGKDGRDGFSLKDFSCEPLDDGRTIRLKFIGQDHEVVEELTLPIPVYRDVYQRENRELYQKHDWLTYGNETWAVLVDKPTSDPGMDRGEWQLVARKGRDGRDRDRAKDHNGPVKL